MPVLVEERNKATYTPQNTTSAGSTAPQSETGTPHQPLSHKKVCDLVTYFGYTTSLVEALKKNCVLTDEQAVSILTSDESCKQFYAQLLSHWVEMVLQNLYECSQKRDYSSYDEVLYVCLNADFLPGDVSPDSLAERAGVSKAKTNAFLGDLASQSRGTFTLRSLGRVLNPSTHAGWVLLWEERMPQVRLQHELERAIPAMIRRLDAHTLLLHVHPRGGKGYRKEYAITGFEAEGLQRGDWVYYWEDLGGKPFLMSQTLRSPYAAQRRADWNEVDESTYMHDAMPTA